MYSFGAVFSENIFSLRMYSVKGPQLHFFFQITRRCGSVYLGVVVLDIGMYISWQSACTSVQALMIGSTEYWDSFVCR